MWTQVASRPDYRTRPILAAPVEQTPDSEAKAPLLGTAGPNATTLSSTEELGRVILITVTAVQLRLSLFGDPLVLLTVKSPAGM